MKILNRAAVLSAVACVSVSPLSPDAMAASATPAPQCAQWTAHQIADGFGMLENLAFDGRGGMLLSNQSPMGTGGSIDRLTPDGARSAVVSDVDGPGGIVVDEHTAFFTTGNTAVAGLTGHADGTIESLDLDERHVATVARGLEMPNGLARLPQGDFVVSKDVGPDTGLTLVDSRTGEHQQYGPDLVSPNGLAVSPDGTRLYASTTFAPTTSVVGINPDTPQAPTSTTTLAGPGPLNAADDLTVGHDEQVYVALNLAGAVVQVDPSTGQACTVAHGLPLTTSVRFGAGPGWDPHSLYATSYLGTVTRLSPPSA